MHSSQYGYGIWLSRILVLALMDLVMWGEMAKYDCELLFANRNSDKFRADAIVMSRSCGVFRCAGNGARGEERYRKRLAANPAIPQNAFFTPEVINSRHLWISVSVLRGDGGTLWLMECNPPFAVVYFRRAWCFLFVPPGQYILMYDWVRCKLKCWWLLMLM